MSFLRGAVVFAVKFGERFDLFLGEFDGFTHYGP